MAKEFRFVGEHAESLNGGRMLHPGEFTGVLDTEDDVVARLIEEGTLVEAAKGAYEESLKEPEVAVPEDGEVVAGDPPADPPKAPAKGNDKTKKKEEEQTA